MYWTIGFITIFMIGGMSGVFMASPPADFQVHNSLFLVAHFHSMIIGVALFGVFAGGAYWFPKIMGFTLNERLGKLAFWFWFIGFFVSFTPLYLLGLMGAPRRIDHYASSTGWQPLYITAAIGFVIISVGIIIQVMQIIVSIKQRKQHQDTTGDPWNGRTLEWSTTSPPPFYNFSSIPTVKGHDAFWEMKQKRRRSPTKYEDIEFPKNTGMGIYISAFSFLAGFGIVWHILWLIVFGLIGSIACVMIRSFDTDTEYVISAEEVKHLESAKGHG
jgi:cytochrome o ubiquinol oxidase subunit I